jgi:enoyl-CoA hydratase/carnithine racemase
MSESSVITQFVSGWSHLSSFTLSSSVRGVLHMQINTNRMNTMTRQFWSDLYTINQLIMQSIDHIRVVVISGHGKLFCAGLDLNDHAQMFTQSSSTPIRHSNNASNNESNSESYVDPSREALHKLTFIEAYQRAISSLESLTQPVISFVHGHCIGGGVDMITACDMRYGVKGTHFSIKEVDVGMSADVGTLQRIERVTGNASLVRDWAFTGRTFDTTEAVQAGLIHPNVFDDYDTGLQAVMKIASTIAAKSPIAIIGTKRMLNYARNHSVNDGLEAHAVWNSVMLQSNDVQVAIQASMNKKKPMFAKL